MAPVSVTDFASWLDLQRSYDPAQEVDRLRVNHQSGTFALPDDDGQRSVLTVVILGLVHQRVMFSEDRRGIPCKSPNGTIGIPGTSFPWDKSSFEPYQYPPSTQGYRELPCNLCRFKEFDTDLKGGKAPACSEQYTLPLFYLSGTGWKVGIFSVQKTAIKPTRDYLTKFQRNREPAYTKFTTISLSRVGKDGKYWSTPAYQEAGIVDRALYIRLSHFYRSMREAITSPPVIDSTGKIVHSQINYKKRDDLSDLIA
jgi:hypothetical protein